MIELTKLNNLTFTLNCDWIESISENPDTTIMLTNGNIYIVKESMNEIIEKTIRYRRELFKDYTNGKFNHGI